MSARPFAEVAIVTHLWDPLEGGREAYLGDLLRALTRRGTVARVFCLKAVGDDRAVTAARRRGELARQVRAWAAADRGRRVLAAGPYPSATHYQLHSGPQALAFEAERESFDSDLRRLLYRPALGWNRRRAALLTAEETALTSPRAEVMVWSESLRRELARRYGLPLDRIAVERPGLDLALFCPPTTADRAFPGEPLDLLFVANNFRLKGLRWAFEALREARRRGVAARLRVVGAGPVRPFRALASRLGVADQVEFLGRVARERLPDLYRQSDALLHPTFYDPFSLATLEALACGCPVITTRRNGVSELVESGGGGFLVNHPQESDALASALAALRDVEVAQRKRGEAARVARRLSFDRHAEAVASWLGVDRE